MGSRPEEAPEFPTRSSLWPLFSCWHSSALSRVALPSEVLGPADVQEAVSPPVKLQTLHPPPPAPTPTSPLASSCRVSQTITKTCAECYAAGSAVSGLTTTITTTITNAITSLTALLG